MYLILNITLFLLYFVIATTALPITTSLFDTLPPDSNAINANDPRFGLVGDGIHDDTIGLMQALNATYYDHNRPNCTLPGSRIVFLEGNGKIYRVTSTIDVRIWQRIIGWGTTRPVLYVPPSTFTNASNIIPLLRGNDYAPGSPQPVNSTDGNNIAFGVGLINVNIKIDVGNVGGTAMRWRIAQGGIIRGVVMDLATDTFSGIYFPGWGHQDIVINGGKYGIYIGDTGAWPSSYRDILLQNQSLAAIAQANFNGPPYPFPAGDWEGSVFTRVTIQNTQYGFLSLPDYGGSSDEPLYGSPIRCILRHVRWSNIAVAFVSLSNFTSFQPAAFTIMDAQGDINNLQYIFYDMDPTSHGKYSVPVSNRNKANINVKFFHAGYDVTEMQGATGPNLRATFNVLQNITLTDNNAVVPALPVSDVAPYPAVPVSSYLVANSSNGVVGDGVTDVTNALNALLQVSAATNRVIYLPTGIYMVSSTIIIPPNASIFGLHCWDTVIRLFDSAGSEFKNSTSPHPIIHIVPDTNNNINSNHNFVTLRIGGLNIQSASGNYTTGQPYPVPTGWTNPNPGAMGLLWETGGTLSIPNIPMYGLFDVFFHPASYPDNHRLGIGNNTEYSLFIQGPQASGSFADIWTCNSYAFGGTWVINSMGPGIFYQLSDEHHYGHEVTLVNSSNWQIWTVQTEDRMDDCAQTIPINIINCSNITVGQLQTNRDGNVTTGAAIAIENTNTGNNNILALHLHVYVWDYHHDPVNFNASICDSGSGNCVMDVDVGLVGDGIDANL